MRAKHVEVMLVAALVLLAAGCQSTRIDSKDSQEAASSEVPLGKLAVEYPSFRTLDELKVWGAPRDATESFHLVEKGDTKAAIRVETWGSGDSWNVVVVYAFDSLRSQWVPRAVWNTEAKGVRTAFDQRSGMIDVRSAEGVLIFQANILAVVARRTRDW